MKFSFLIKTRRKTKLLDDLLITSLSQDEFVALQSDVVEDAQLKFFDG